MSRVEMSTLFQHQLADADVGGLLFTSGLYPQFGDAVVDQTPREILGGSSGNGKNTEMVSAEQRIPRRIKNFPIARAATKRRSFRETDSWEGLVTSTSDEGVVATLNRRYQDFPAEEALIPWDEIDEADHALAREGATFQWKVGYLQIEGQQLSISHIEFRRAANFSAREQTNARTKAAAYASLFDA